MGRRATILIFPGGEMHPMGLLEPFPALKMVILFCYFVPLGPLLGVSPSGHVTQVQFVSQVSAYHCLNLIHVQDPWSRSRDGLEQAAESGASSIVQPGGSIRDQEVIDAADERGISMLFTGHRLFRH